MLRLLTIKYVECKCIRSAIGNPKDWEKQEQETIKDVDGYPIMNVYKDYCKCHECRERE